MSKDAPSVPPALNSVPEVSRRVRWWLRPHDISASADQVSLAGSKRSVVHWLYGSYVKVSVPRPGRSPPVTSTESSASSVAWWLLRATPKLAVGVQAAVAGSYASQ